MANREEATVNILDNDYAGPDSTPDPVISDTTAIQHIMTMHTYFVHTDQGYLYNNMSIVAGKTK